MIRRLDRWLTHLGLALAAWYCRRYHDGRHPAAQYDGRDSSGG